jgi:hypothetical protein
MAPYLGHNAVAGAMLCPEGGDKVINLDLSLRHRFSEIFLEADYSSKESTISGF